MEAKDVLEPIAMELLLEHIEILKPFSNRGLKFLINHLKWRQNSEMASLENLASYNYEYKVYVPCSSAKKNCTFVGIESTETCFSVFIHTLQDTHDELFHALKDTKLIKWNLNPRFDSVPEDYMELIERISIVSNLKWETYTHSSEMVLPKAVVSLFETTIPSYLVLKDLAEEDIEKIDENWPHRYNGSADYMRALLKFNWGLALCLQDTNELCSWVFLNENRAAGILYTLNKFRCKGYAAILMKMFCIKYVREMDMDVLAYVESTNIPSLNLVKKMGFIEKGTCRWIKFSTDTRI